MTAFLRTIGDKEAYSLKLKEALRSDNTAWHLCLLRTLVASLSDGTERTGSERLQDQLPKEVAADVTCRLGLPTDTSWDVAIAKLEELHHDSHIEARILGRLGYMAIRSSWGSQLLSKMLGSGESPKLTET